MYHTKEHDLSARLLKVVEGSLEVKLPTIWRDGKAEVGRVREEKSRSDMERWKSRGGKSQRGEVKK